MKWLLLFPLAIIFEVIAKLLWPVLPLFAVERMGPTDNNNSSGVEPRLPRWLAWFDTPDNGLWGDTGWRTIHCKNHWDDYIGMALWLLRNSATGFSRSVLARPVFGIDITHSGEPTASWDRKYGWLFARTKDGAWQFKCAYPIGSTGWCFQLNYGWQMNTLIETGAMYEVCHYKFSNKLKRAVL